MLKVKRLLSLMLVIMIVLSLAACKKEEANAPALGDDGENPVDSKDTEGGQNTIYPFKFTDDTGKEIVLDKAPDKVASGSPALTEIIFAINANDKLSGVTDYCNFPEEVVNIEKTGDYNGPNIERMIELGINLYVTDHVSDDARKMLEDAKINIAVFKAENYKEVFNEIELFGSIFDKKSEANSTLAKMNEREENLLNAIKDTKSKRVFHEVWHDPLMSSGPGSFIDEMINILGSENIAGDTDSPYPSYSVEKLIEKNPEVYITADDGMKTAEEIKARTGYEQIDAIKNDRIYFLDGDIISRPGPRIVEGLEILAEAIYSEVFSGK